MRHLNNLLKFFIDKKDEKKKGKKSKKRWGVLAMKTKYLNQFCDISDHFLSHLLEFFLTIKKEKINEIKDGGVGGGGRKG